MEEKKGLKEGRGPFASFSNIQNQNQIIRQNLNIGRSSWCRKTVLRRNWRVLANQGLVHSSIFYRMYGREKTEIILKILHLAEKIVVAVFPSSFPSDISFTKIPYKQPCSKLKKGHTRLSKQHNHVIDRRSDRFQISRQKNGLSLSDTVCVLQFAKSHPKLAGNYQVELSTRLRGKGVASTK